MSQNTESSSLYADFMLLQCDTSHGQMDSNILNNNERAYIKETIKTVDLSKEYCSSELLKEGSAKKGAYDLLSWGPMLQNQLRKYESRPQYKPDVTNTQCFEEDLITFEDDKLIDISREQWVEQKTDKMVEPKPKYYDDLKTIFDTSFINKETDNSINCTEIITLGRVNQLKIDATTTSPKRNNSEETVSLGRVNIIKPLNERTDSNSNPINETVNIIDLFKNLSVTPKDVCKPSIMTNSHEVTSIPLSINHQEQNHTKSSKINVCTNKDVDSACVKADKILEVMGNNVIIKCERTYVISAEPKTVCSMCENDIKLKTIDNEAIKVKEPDTSEVNPRNIATMPATVIKKPKTVEFVNINHSTSLLNLKTKKTPPQIDINKNDKSIQTLSITSEREHSATRLLQGLNSTRLLPVFEPEVLVENHAKTRIRWQKERRAIDEFINKGKVIK